MKYSLLFSLFVILFLSTCTKSDCKALLKPECACTKQYDPVCGCNDVTYGNACMAECSSITEYTRGECPK